MFYSTKKPHEWEESAKSKLFGSELNQNISVSWVYVGEFTHASYVKKSLSYTTAHFPS